VRVRAQATGAWEVAAKAMPRAAAARAGCVAAAARLWTETVKLRTMARTTVGRRWDDGSTGGCSAVTVHGLLTRY